MILRLVYSFFFFSFVTGNQRLEDSKKMARSGSCENKVCLCQEQLEAQYRLLSLKTPNIHKNTQDPLKLTPPQKVEEGHFGTRPIAHGIISSGPRYVSNPTRVETKSFDVELVSDNEGTIPVQIVNDENSHTEKTICFTPRMVHRMVKAALEYVSQIPSDINIIIDKIDQELNRMSDPESLEDQYVKKPLYPLDSRTIFQMLNKPRSETRTNLVLKYELPSIPEPHCREALEKLIEIAYTAYLELEQHPQCREYLYRFASNHPEDRPNGHLENGPDLQSLIAIILEQVDKHRPKTPAEYKNGDYSYIPISENDTPISELPIPQIHEITIPQIHEIKIPQIHEIHEIHEYNIPKIQEVTIPQIHEIDIPHDPIPLQPDETINILIDLLKNKDHPDNRGLFDRVMNIVEDNPNHFHPKIRHILITLLNAQKHKNIPRLADIFLLLLDSEKKKQWPWNEKVTEHILSFLIPNEHGDVDPRIIDIILNLFNNNKPTNEKHVEYILSLLKPFKEGDLDSRTGDIVLDLINSHQNNLLHPNHIDILLQLLKNSNGLPDAKEIDIINHLSRWNEMGVNPKHLDTIFALLKPDLNGNSDPRSLDIVHALLTENKYLNPNHLEFILSFLYPENGIIDSRRIDIIHFILNNALSQPKLVNILISLLQDNPHNVLNSRFIDILLFLNSNRLLTPELLETIISLLSDEVTGQLDDGQVKTLIFQLSPYKQSNPNIVVDILTLLNQGGLHGNIVEWLETTTNNGGMPNRGASTPNLHIVLEKVEDIPGRLIDNNHDYRTPDDAFTTPNNDLLAIFKWLDSQGLLNPDHGSSNSELINKLLNILETGERKLGVVELTYMLKHEKPLVYQPVYYVKYRLPILNFISNMKSLLMENPHLTADPIKLLQELIVTSNVTEISPNLQGYPKEEILKLTVNDGDLVQAKILDEQNMNLNEQITYVHGLNTDISPEEILQLNRMNEATYYPNILQIKTSGPEKVTIHEVDKIVELPTLHYQTYQRKVPLQQHTLKVYDSSHYRTLHSNPQLRSPE